jgi:hypothetical protein
MKRIVRLLVASTIMAVVAHLAYVALFSLGVPHERPTLVGVLLPDDGIVYARRVISPSIRTAGIDPTVTVRDRGHHILVSGHIECSEGARTHIQITLNQDATGAEAQGQTQLLCTGERQTWTIKATIRGPILFQNGAAEACGVAVAHGTGSARDTFEWCRAGGVTIIGASSP